MNTFTVALFCGACLCQAGCNSKNDNPGSPTSAMILQKDKDAAIALAKSFMESNDSKSVARATDAVNMSYSYAGLDRDTGLHMVDAVHQQDKSSAVPGGGSGLSRRLLVNLSTQKVERALKFQ